MDEFVLIDPPLGDDSTPADVEAWLAELAEKRRRADAEGNRALLQAVDRAEVDARWYLEYVRSVTED